MVAAATTLTCSGSVSYIKNKGFFLNSLLSTGCLSLESGKTLCDVVVKAEGEKPKHQICTHTNAVILSESILL